MGMQGPRTATYDRDLFADDGHVRFPEMSQRRHGRDGSAVEHVAFVVEEVHVDP